MNWFNKLEKPHQSRDMEIKTIYIGGSSGKVLDVGNFFPFEVYMRIGVNGDFQEAFYFDKLQERIRLSIFTERYKICMPYSSVASDTVELWYEDITQKYHFKENMISDTGFIKLFSRCNVL